jgi:hypothetical protein
MPPTIQISRDRHWPCTREDWFCLPLPVRQKWWELTSFDRHPPPADLLDEVRGYIDLAGPGRAGLGEARHGAAWRGRARQGRDFIHLFSDRSEPPADLLAEVAGALRGAS